MKREIRRGRDGRKGREGGGEGMRYSADNKQHPFKDILKTEVSLPS